MYADSVTDSMERAIRETNRRREIQMAYNKEHGIVPKTIVKSVAEIIEISAKDTIDKKGKRLSDMEKMQLIKAYTAEMKEAAKLLEFEQAAFLRDKIKKLQDELDGVKPKKRRS